MWFIMRRGRDFLVAASAEVAFGCGWEEEAIPVSIIVVCKVDDGSEEWVLEASSEGDDFEALLVVD